MKFAFALFLFVAIAFGCATYFLASQPTQPVRATSDDYSIESEYIGNGASYHVDEDYEIRDRINFSGVEQTSQSSDTYSVSSDVLLEGEDDPGLPVDPAFGGSVTRSTTWKSYR